MFANGQRLAEAAYYRIYFAKMLQRGGQYDKALYIDSDTIVQGDLNPLVNHKSTTPLIARQELDRPNVQRAIALHGLEAKQYFNSGVLMFDMRNDELGPALERSIEAVGNSREALMFHDQCALNIGFKGAFESLDTRYNFFIDPMDSGVPADSAIFHYFGRPKPWEPAYLGSLSRLWFLNWYQLALHVGSTDAVALYRMSNGDC